MFGALKYHLVRASDGFHLVPKVSAELAGTYIDVRGFNLTDWNEHRWLAMALVQSDKGHVLNASAGEQFQQSMTGMFQALGGKTTR